jgi:hypothetical protein
MDWVLLVEDVLCVPHVKKKNMVAECMRVQRSCGYAMWPLCLEADESLLLSRWNDARATIDVDATRLVVRS